MCVEAEFGSATVASPNGEHSLDRREPRVANVAPPIGRVSSTSVPPLLGDASVFVVSALGLSVVHSGARHSLHSIIDVTQQEGSTKMDILRELLGERMRFELWKLRDALLDHLYGRVHRHNIFDRIYQRNLWGDTESRSGGGSSIAMTENIRRELPILFHRFGVRTVLDAPCGDFAWMREIVGEIDSYVGMDIVQDLIARNSDHYVTPRVKFLCGDITSDPLPRADLIICRDCFIHLPTRMIVSALKNFRASGARLLLLTNSPSVKYHDIPIGSFRPIDFTRRPFSFPEPEYTMCEDASRTHLLCMWRLETLPWS